MINILQTISFKKKVNNLYLEQKEQLNHVMQNVINTPLIGERQRGALCNIYVYTFKIGIQTMLLAYIYNPKKDVLTFIAIGKVDKK